MASAMAMFPNDEFSFTVERWTPDGNNIEQTLCFASHLLVAKGAFEGACKLENRARLTLRQGVRVIQERKVGDSHGGA